MAIRGIALELERIANHVGDLGALANDVGFLPTASFCGRIRGEWLNLTALLCGNRFGRNLIIPGGTAFDLTSDQIENLQKKIGILEKETKDAVCLLWENQSVLSRFEEIGEVTRETAVNLGLVGPAARASGVYRDIRYNFPSGCYQKSGILVSIQETGDVFARAYVRWLEIQQAIDFILEQLISMPAGIVHNPIGSLAPDHVVITFNEGWRGEICHVAITNEEGTFRRYKMVDPSFHNWAGLAMALRNQGISDFPICNKSFNLSYCGHDL
jgi:Ni,Fe-hydrogenase III large subunit